MQFKSLDNRKIFAFDRHRLRRHCGEFFRAKSCKCASGWNFNFSQNYPFKAPWRWYNVTFLFSHLATLYVNSSDPRVVGMPTTHLYTALNYHFSLLQPMSLCLSLCLCLSSKQMANKSFTQIKCSFQPKSKHLARWHINQYVADAHIKARPVSQAVEMRSCSIWSCVTSSAS